MADENVTHQLAAIVYADVSGYSRLTEADELGTHRQLSKNGAVKMVPQKWCRGRLVKMVPGPISLASCRSRFIQTYRPRHLS
jgi:hypothetical protein